jgi:hypothetical protein
MKTKRMKLMSFTLPLGDISIELLKEKLNHLKTKLKNLDHPVSNARFRFESGCFDDGEEEHWQIIVQVWYETPMTEEDLKKQKEFRKLRMDEQEARDKILFEKLKERYGW